MLVFSVTGEHILLILCNQMIIILKFDFRNSTPGWEYIYMDVARPARFDAKLNLILFSFVWAEMENIIKHTYNKIKSESSRKNIFSFFLNLFKKYKISPSSDVFSPRTRK